MSPASEDDIAAVIAPAGAARSLQEIRYYMELIACPRCGQRGWAKAPSGRLDDHPTEHVSEDGLVVETSLLRCANCGARVEFRIRKAADCDEWTAQSDAYSGLAGPSPSTLFTPPMMWAEIDRRLTDVLTEPENGSVDAFLRSSSAVRAIDTCVRELTKFLEPATDAVADRWFTTPEDREARANEPDRYTRRGIEQEAEANARRQRQHATFRPRFQALQKAEADAKLPPPPPFSRESVAQHRAWANRKDGEPAVGRQLEATDVAQPDTNLSALHLPGMVLTRVDLARSRLSSSDLHHGRWTDVSLVGADLSSAHLYSSLLTRVDFTDANLALVRLGDSRYDGCKFTRARLDRATWYRSDLMRCDFTDAVFGQSAIHQAVFSDCTFRRASFACDPKGVLGDMWRNWYYRCDLRDADFSGRDLHGEVYFDCVFAAGKGPRSMKKLHPIRCSIDHGDHVQHDITAADLAAMWKLTPDQVHASDDPYLRASLRSVVTWEMEEERNWRVTRQKWPWLILQEHERDPDRYPLPVPWDIFDRPAPTGGAS